MIPYSKDDLVYALNHPIDGLRQLILREFSNFRVLLNRHDPPIMERDWDNLLLLDACRYDLFEEVNTLPGDLEGHISNASNTAYWVQRNFQGNNYPDTVLVTATPKYTANEVDDNFHEIVKVWENNWNDELRTIPAEEMNYYVRRAVKEYPNKRILAHYIPPHIPFIGPSGQKLPHKIVFSGNVIRHDMDKPDIWGELKRGNYKKYDVWKAYRENLDIALDSIQEILNELSGKTVISSDHGNGFGEFGVYGHPANRHIKELVKVPWHIYQKGERKDIIPGDLSHRNTQADESVVQKRLEDLGYVG